MRLEGNIILVNGATIKFRTERSREEIAEEFHFGGMGTEGFAHVTGRNDRGNDVDIYVRREAVAAVVYTDESFVAAGAN